MANTVHAGIQSATCRPGLFVVTTWVSGGRSGGSIRGRITRNCLYWFMAWEAIGNKPVFAEAVIILPVVKALSRACLREVAKRDLFTINPALVILYLAAKAYNAAYSIKNS